jgi:hypothetical protein
MHNVHETEPVLFETRWVMSYLAGPLTREQIKSLSSAQALVTRTPTAVAASPSVRPEALARPVLPPDLPQFYVDAARAPSAGERLVYYPRLLAAGTISYQNARLKVAERRDFMFSVEPDDDSATVDWISSEPLAMAPSDLDQRPDPDAAFAELPGCMGRPKQYAAWEKDMRRWLRAERPLILYKSPQLKETSRPDETERDFRIRLQQLGNEQRDLQVAKLRERYEKQVVQLEDRLRRAEQAMEKQAEQARDQKLDTALSFGTAVLGALLGRKRVSVTSATRMGTAVRKAGRIGQESGDVRRAEATVTAVQAKLTELQSKFDIDVEALNSAYDAQAEELEEIAINPRATDIHVALHGLGWLPYFSDDAGRLEPAWAKT